MHFRARISLGQLGTRVCTRYVVKLLQYHIQTLGPATKHPVSPRPPGGSVRHTGSKARVVVWHAR